MGPGQRRGPGADPERRLSVTIDATALKDFADVELPCDVNGLVAVCDESSLYPGSTYNPSSNVRLDPKDGAEARDFGEIKVTGAGEGLEFNEHTVDVLVGGPNC
ncbi:hypothetical protein ACLGIH_19405 [Streptomyces sp. HMX87]|uniref:hypothetical protein n=1 Tax=Streptomyces sp. HMX87 TaxID=3390849 RepID=UPI003A8A5F12